MAQILERLHSTTPMAQVHSVAVTRPFIWLRLGYADMLRVPRISVTYGALVALFGVLLLTSVWEATYLVPAMIGGFLLVAPFLAIVFYKLSQQLESGEPADARAATDAWRHNTSSIALFGLMLAVALIAWERTAAIIFALFYGGTVPDMGHMVRDVLFSGDYIGLVIAFMGAGALLAAVVYALSVVTTPMLMDRDVDVVTAALTSLRCCSVNPLAMVVWAAVIAALTAIGFATLMLGLIFIFPLLGHASWHAYREMVE